MKIKCYNYILLERTASKIIRCVVFKEKIIRQHYMAFKKDYDFQKVNCTL